MRIQEPGSTVVMVSTTSPDISLQTEMATRGIRVLWARTIHEATALLNSVVNKTIVLTEVALKDGTWRDLIEDVRGNSVQILLVSSSSTAELWWDALECGIEDILPTPLPASRLCEYLYKQFAKQKQ